MSCHLFLSTAEFYVQQLQADDTHFCFKETKGIADIILVS